MFAADFETDLTTAGLLEASPALAGDLAAELPDLAATVADLATALTAGLATGLEASFALDLALDLAATGAALDPDFAVGFTAALGLGDAAAMVFLMPTDRFISVLFCMKCAGWHELAQQTLGLRKPVCLDCVKLYFNRISVPCWIRLPQLDG